MLIINYFYILSSVPGLAYNIHLVRDLSWCTKACTISTTFFFKYLVWCASGAKCAKSINICRRTLLIFPQDIWLSPVKFGPNEKKKKKKDLCNRSTRQLCRRLRTRLYGCIRLRVCNLSHPPPPPRQPGAPKTLPSRNRPLTHLPENNKRRAISGRWENAEKGRVARENAARLKRFLHRPKLELDHLTQTRSVGILGEDTITIPSDANRFGLRSDGVSSFRQRKLRFDPAKAGPIITIQGDPFKMSHPTKFDE